MGPDNSSTSTWSLAGADSGKFAISSSNGTRGELTFKAKPDYEARGDANKDNVYEVTVVAADDEGNRGTMDVKVTVANEEEAGTVTLSRTAPRVGIPVTASLEDPDGSISKLTWRWYSDARSTGNLDENAIEGAMSDTYTPTEDDEDGMVMLRVRAMYTDGHGAMKNAMGVSSNAVAVDSRNRAPEFADQDMETDGTQNETAEREVEENTKALAGNVGDADADDDATTTTDNSADNVGRRVMAEDPDPNEDPLIYTLSGTDAGLFRVRDNGQIEVGDGTKLNYETRTTYEVTLMAEDSFGDRASIMVTIMVTDLDEVPDVSGDEEVEHAENGMGSVATFTAVDPEMTDIILWSLSGDDADDFMIGGGVLTFKKRPNFEKAADMGMDNMYSVTVQATDDTFKVGMKDVTVEVTNVNEPGTVTLSAVRPQSAVAFTATLEDPDGGVTGTTWQWAKASSRNGSYTSIDKAISSAYTPKDGDVGSYLRAMVSYTDGEGSGKTARMTSANSVQAVRGANEAPEFADDQDPVMLGDQAEATRTVAENTDAGQAIGDPVVAEDEDSDILTYTLTGTDAGLFDIDPATGQLMTKDDLDYEKEENDGGPARDLNDEHYQDLHRFGPGHGPGGRTPVGMRNGHHSSRISAHLRRGNRDDHGHRRQRRTEFGGASCSNVRRGGTAL